MELPVCGLVIVSTLHHWKNWRHISLSSLHARCRRGHSPLSLYTPLVVQYDNYPVLLFVDGGRFFSLNLTVSVLGWFQENGRWCQGGQSARPWGSSTTRFVTCLLVNHCLFLLGYWSKLLVAGLLDSFSNKKCRLTWVQVPKMDKLGLSGRVTVVWLTHGMPKSTNGTRSRTALVSTVCCCFCDVMRMGSWEAWNWNAIYQHSDLIIHFHASQLPLCSWSVAHVYKLVRLVQSTWSFWLCWVLL